MADVNIVVAGAGVSGLTSALLLAQASPRYRITVVTKHLPGDLSSVEYASPWAGAHYTPVAEPNSREAKFEADTFPYLWDLAKNKPEAGIHFKLHITASKTRDLAATRPWWAELFSDYRSLSASELPKGAQSAISFTTVVINTPHYLNYLVSRLLALGVTFKRSSLAHILDARPLHHSGQPADVIVNCTALGALRLGGVEDQRMVPARGQTVLVCNTAPFQGSFTNNVGDERTYLMTRPVAGGTILGGCYQKGSWNGKPDMELAERIMKNAVEFCPDLVKDGPLDVISHNVGLRPLREGGFRVEREVMRDADKAAVQIVHNYGHGSDGYQASYGCATKVAEFVEEAAGEPQGSVSSKL